MFIQRHCRNLKIFWLIMVYFVINLSFHAASKETLTGWYANCTKRQILTACIDLTLLHLSYLEPHRSASLAFLAKVEAASSSVLQINLPVFLRLLLFPLSSPSPPLPLPSWTWTARWSPAASCWSGGLVASGRSYYREDTGTPERGKADGGRKKM